ncbi:hypothetical protein [Maribacter sp. IgM3_T14_3]|uniref:hypothetical protein n=1 Tax=Maribacter sp. IgM3_T14_3 TaxID=3415140 RepID=UPI003C6EEB71
MKHFISPILFLLFCLSNISCELDNVTEIDNDLELAVETACTDEQIVDYLSTCKWNTTDVSDETVQNLTIDFSNQNIHVYNDNGVVVDEGYWEVANGLVTFNNLSATLANYIGEWEVAECGAEALLLQKGNSFIGLEQDCTVVAETACTDEQIVDYLSTCKWNTTDVSDETVQNLTIDFSNQNIHVYNDNGVVVDEGYWEVANGLVTFNNLSATLANYIGEWEVAECGAEALLLQKGNSFIGLEQDCTVVAETACTDEQIVDYLSTCKWNTTDVSDETVQNLTIDFSNQNIHVYNDNGVVVDEGYWEVANGLVTFNNLSATLANYIGEWEVAECGAEALLLQKGNSFIGLEQDCTVVAETACTDEQIVDYLSTCKWNTTDVSDETVQNLTIDFSNQNIHVYNDNGVVVDEGYWEVANGLVTFNNLSATLANYIGEWEVAECGAEALLLQKGNSFIGLEQDCD